MNQTPPSEILSAAEEIYKTLAADPNSPLHKDLETKLSDKDLAARKVQVFHSMMVG